METIGANPNIKKIEARLENLKKPGFEALNKSLGQLKSLEKLKLSMILYDLGLKKSHKNV